MFIASAGSLQRLAAGLAGRHTRWQPCSLPSLRCLSSTPAAAALPMLPRCSVGESSSRSRSSPKDAPAPLPLPPPHRLACGPTKRLPPVASYSVITGSNSSSSGSSSSGGTPVKLIVYSKEGCHLCNGLEEKLEALLERAAFMPCPLSGVELEVRDITSKPEWEVAYGPTIPVLVAVASNGGCELEVPRPSPRLSIDALQKHIERFLTAQGLGARQ